MTAVIRRDTVTCCSAKLIVLLLLTLSLTFNRPIYEPHSVHVEIARYSHFQKLLKHIPSIVLMSIFIVKTQMQKSKAKNTLPSSMCFASYDNRYDATNTSSIYSYI